MVFSGFGNYCSLRPETLQMQTVMKSIKVCQYSRSRSFHDDLILQDQSSGERSQDQWSSGLLSSMECSVLNVQFFNDANFDLNFLLQREEFHCTIHKESFVFNGMLSIKCSIFQ